MSKRTDKSGDSRTAVPANRPSSGAPFDDVAFDGEAFEGSAAEEIELLMGAMFDGELSEADASRLTALCEGPGGKGPGVSVDVDDETFREVRRAMRAWHKDLMTDAATGEPHRCDVWSRIAPAVEVIAATNAQRSARERRFNAAVRRVRAWIAGDNLDSRDAHARGGMGWGLAIGSAAAAMFLFTQYAELSSPHGVSAMTARRGSDANGPMTVASRSSDETSSAPSQPVMLAGLSSQQFIESGAGEGEHDIVNLAEQLARQTGRGGNPFAVIPRMEGIPGAEGVTILAARQDGSSESSAGELRGRSVPMRLMAPQIDGFAASSRDFAMSVGTDGGLRAGNADIAWIRSANRFKLLSPRAEEGAPVIWVARRNASTDSAPTESVGASAASR